MSFSLTLDLIVSNLSMQVQNLSFIELHHQLLIYHLHIRHGWFKVYLVTSPLTAPPLTASPLNQFYTETFLNLIHLTQIYTVYIIFI